MIKKTFLCAILLIVSISLLLAGVNTWKKDYNTVDIPIIIEGYVMHESNTGNWFELPNTDVIISFQGGGASLDFVTYTQSTPPGFYSIVIGEHYIPILFNTTTVLATCNGVSVYIPFILDDCIITMPTIYIDHFVDLNPPIHHQD